jgi:HK97 family phage major capsid protein
MKALLEKKNSLIDEMESLLDKAKTEVRAFTDEEDSRIEEIKKEVRGLEKLIAHKEEFRSLSKEEIKAEKGTEEMSKEERQLEVIEKEEREFIEAVRNNELRNLTAGQNGKIIPVSIASDVINKVVELCPILELSQVYNIAGDLRLPKYEADSATIAAAYADEFTELTEKTATFSTIDLSNQIVGLLVKISKSLINRADFDVRGFIVNEIAKKIAEFLEKEMLVGNTSNRIQGAINTKNVVTTAAPTKITTDEIIDLQMKLPTVYQKNAVFVMHRDVLKEVRKLKDGQGNYILQPDFRAPFGWTILGRPVYLSDNMDKEIATGKNVILYADFSGYAVKITKNVEIQFLQEKYATQYALGIVSYVELDAKIADEQKIAKLAMK